MTEPRKFVFVNGKGGVGKSTVTLLTACALASAGKKVGLIDSDVNQKTLTKGVTYLLNNNLLPEFVSIYDPTKSYDIIITDTPGRINSMETQEALKEASRIILISSPSSADLFTTIDTANLLKDYGYQNKSLLLFNRVRKGASNLKNLPQLTELTGLKGLKNFLYQRSSFEGLFLNGYFSLISSHQKELADVVMEILLS